MKHRSHTQTLEPTTKQLLRGHGLRWLVTCAMLLTSFGSNVGFTQEPEPASQESVEEVIVYGKKSLTRLRAELHLAEENVFEMFNSLNSSDEFDIHCVDQSQAGTRIKRRVCKPNYAKDLRSEATQRWLNSGDANATDGQNFVPMSAQIQAKEKQLRAEMELLVMQHPEFLEAVAQYDRARKVMAQEQEKRCNGKRVLCQ